MSLLLISVLELNGWGFDVRLLNYSTTGNSSFTPLIVGVIRISAFALIIVTVIAGLNKRDKERKKYELELEKLNRELIAANEEMASLNEELHTANEKLHSSNQELLLKNIRELKEAKGKIKAERNLLRAIIDNIPDNIFVLDDASRNVINNKSLYKMVGAATEEETLGKNAIDYFGDKGKEFIKDNEYVFSTGEPILGKEITIEREGITRVFLNSKVPLRDDTGKIIGLVGISHDITERKNQEQIVSEYRQNLDIIFNNTSDHFELMDASGRVLLFNKAYANTMEEMMGITPRTGMHFLDLVPQPRKEAAQTIFNKVVKGESVSDIAKLPSPGGVKCFSLKIIPIITNGIVTHICRTATDITERENQEIALSEYRDNLDIIFNHTTDHFLLCDASMKVVSFNHSFQLFMQQIAAIKPVIGMHFSDLSSKYRKTEANLLFNRALEGESFTAEASVIDMEGNKLYQRLCYVPVFKHGKVTHVSISAIDITVQKNKENLLLESEARLRSILDSTLDGFLLLNTEYRVISVNEGYKALFKDLSDKITAGVLVFDTLSSEKADQLKVDLENVRAGKVVQYQTHQHNDHVSKWLTITITPVITIKNRFFGYCITAHDITAEKQVESAIRASKQRYRALIDNGLDVTTISDLKGEILFCSNNLLKILGYKSLDGYREIVHPEEREQLKDRQLFIYNNPDVPVNYSMRLKHKEGGWRWVEATTVNLMHVEEVKGVVTSFRDITERRLIEEKLKQNHFFLEKAAEAGNMGYWTYEPGIEVHNIRWSKEVQIIFEADESEFDGKITTFFQFVHPDDRDRIQEALHTALKESQTYNVDHRIILKNGKIKWLNERAQIIKSEKGEPILMVGITQDITERKVFEEMLREYNDRFTIVSKATNDIIWDWDITHDRIVYNDAMTSLLGYNENNRDSSAHWREERIHPEDHDRIVEAVKNVFDTHSLKGEFSYRYRAASGEYKYIRDRAYVVYEEGGKPVRMTGAMQDVTELMEYRISLEQKVEERTRDLHLSLQKEKELVGMKSRFISIASHEFRTPLSTILLASGFVRKFMGRMSKEDLDRKMDSVEKQVRHMTDLLDDVLLIGRAEAGKIEVKWVTVDLKDLFETVASEVVNSAKKSHRINVRFETIQPTFKTDEGLMRNILINLLTNAIKFSPPSNPVNLTVTCKLEQLIITVQDYGIGIAQSDLSKLSEPFFRGGNVAEIAGTGLGLSIVKKAANLLGGELCIASQLGEGTLVTVTLPLYS